MDASHALELPADGGLRALLDAPFVLGEGPFCIKGNAYRSHMDYVASYVPGGHAAQLEALRALDAARGDSLASHFSQRFLASEWYDVYPLAVAGFACAQLTGVDFGSFVYNRACVQAREDIGGIHRFLLRFISAKQVSLRVPGLMSRYFDFVTVESHTPDPGTVQTVFRGVPVALAPWLGAVMEAYIVTVVEIAGNERPRSDGARLWSEGEAHGVELCANETLLRFGAGGAAGLGFG